MIITFAIKIFLFILAMFDVAIGTIPGMDRISAVSSTIPSALNDFFGFIHSVLPNTLAITSYFMTIIISLYIYKKVFTIIISSVIFSFVFTKAKSLIPSR